MNDDSQAELQIAIISLKITLFFINHQFIQVTFQKF